MEDDLPQRHDWSKEPMFGDAQDYKKTYDEKMAVFNDDELAVHYEHDSKPHTLAELIHMLFDSTGNCHRVADQLPPGHVGWK